VAALAGRATPRRVRAAAKLAAETARGEAPKVKAQAAEEAEEAEEADAKGTAAPAEETEAATAEE
jgi:hypothetical protein